MGALGFRLEVLSLLDNKASMSQSLRVQIIDIVQLMFLLRSQFHWNPQGLGSRSVPLVSEPGRNQINQMLKTLKFASAKAITGP